MTPSRKLAEVVRAVGDDEADRLIVEEGGAAAAWDHLVLRRVVCPLGGCAGSMGCACPC